MGNILKYCEFSIFHGVLIFMDLMEII